MALWEIGILVLCWTFFCVFIIVYVHRVEVNRHKQRDEDRRVITSRYIRQDLER